MPESSTAVEICRTCGNPENSLCERHAGMCVGCCPCEQCSDCDAYVEHTCDSCFECEACCTCNICSGCDQRVESRCDDCGECSNCCDCTECGECGRRNPHFMCDDCGVCGSCCGCEPDYDEEEDEEYNSAVSFSDPSEHEPTFWQALSRRDRQRNPSARLLACEIEVANCTDHYTRPIDKAIQKWGGCIVEDGSLPAMGFEINTAPAGGDHFLTQIEEICAALKEQNARIDRSCGLHVHADARDLHYWQIQNVIKLYARVEDALFSCVPHSRRDNDFCVRCGPEYLHRLGQKYGTFRSWRFPQQKSKKKPERDIKQILAQTVYYCNKDSLGHLRRDRRPGSRYYALNIHSWFYRGTLECRLAAGTVSEEKIVNWSLLWGALIDRAAKLTTQEYQNLPENSLDCLLQIAPSDTIRNWLLRRKAQFLPKYQEEEV